MQLKEKLEYHYKAFDRSQISPDPLQFLHLFSDEREIELIGFIASIFAYGNVAQIINTLNKFLLISNNKPLEFILNFNPQKKKNYLNGLKHRFYTEKDIIDFLSILNKIYSGNEMLKNIFLKFYDSNEKNLKNAITNFSNYFLSSVKKENKNTKNSAGIKFMFPLPELGSACKRMNLFLRWMVRKDELDFGIWNEIPPDKLIIPVDTHISKVCKSLNLTSAKSVSWKMAEEITENLKKYDPVDPVKYDFAICHIGMRKLQF